jgi:hypothetical protein
MSEIAGLIPQRKDGLAKGRQQATSPSQSRSRKNAFICWASTVEKNIGRRVSKGERFSIRSVSTHAPRRQHAVRRLSSTGGYQGGGWSWRRASGSGSTICAAVWHRSSSPRRRPTSRRRSAACGTRGAPPCSIITPRRIWMN